MKTDKKGSHILCISMIVRKGVEKYGVNALQKGEGCDIMIVMILGYHVRTCDPEKGVRADEFSYIH